MKKVLFMLLVMFALSACQSKDSYVKEFSDFVDKVEMEAADYTDKDWKKADLKFSDLSTNLYAKFEEELSAEIKKILDEAGTKGVAIGADCTISSDIAPERLELIRKIAAEYTK